jgi:hypothetical protein
VDAVRHRPKLRDEVYLHRVKRRRS